MTKETICLPALTATTAVISAANVQMRNLEEQARRGDLSPNQAIPKYNRILKELSQKLAKINA